MSLLKHKWEQLAVIQAMFPELLADASGPERDKWSKSFGEAIELIGSQARSSEL